MWPDVYCTSLKGKYIHSGLAQHFVKRPLEGMKRGSNKMNWKWHDLSFLTAPWRREKTGMTGGAVVTFWNHFSTLLKKQDKIKVLQRITEMCFQFVSSYSTLDPIILKFLPLAYSGHCFIYWFSFDQIKPRNWCVNSLQTKIKDARRIVVLRKVFRLL